MKKRNVAIWILLAVIIVIVIFIFGNSLKSRDASKSDSDFIVSIISPIIEKIFGRVPENIGFIVRKLAHLTEFAFLGLSAMALASRLKKIWSDVYGYTCFCVLLIAVFDEFIQIFSGRGSSVSDVLIDLFGALVGFLIHLIIVTLRSRFKNNKIEEKE